MTAASVLTITALLAGALAACGGDDGDGAGEIGQVTEEVVSPTGPEEVEAPEAAQPYRIAFAVPHFRDPYWVNMAYGVIDEGEQLGVEDVSVLGAGGYANVQDQLNQINDFVQQGVDGIILAAVDFEATVGPVERALAAGVPVVSAGSPTNSDEIAWVLIDDEELGDLQAEFIAGELPDEGGEVATLDGAAAASWARARAQSAKDGLQERNPNIEIVAEHTSELDRAEGGNIAGDILQTDPDVDFITCVADILCKGVGDTLRRTGREGDPRVSTATWNRDTEEMLRDEVIDFIVGERPTLAGRWALRTIVKQLNGADVPRITHVPVEGYTRDNIDDVDLTLETAPEGWSP